MTWYPKEINKRQLSPEIKALPDSNNMHMYKSQLVRCPCCSGFTEVFDKKKDVYRTCLICKGEGKVFYKA